MKTVAIIGAGPSGLVAAKTLIRSKQGSFQVRIFEKTAAIGGLWAVNKDRPYDGMLNPDMPTNLSRFNIGFSDLAWSSVGLEGHVHYWPKAWQVNQYLRMYVKRYIPDEVFSFNACVTYAGTDRASDNIEKWKLRWQSTTKDSSTEEHEEFFDYLIVATGLFGASAMPSFTEAENAGVKIVHSTKLRRIQDVAPDGANASGTILVVGGGMSGGDVSTVLATQLSHDMHAPSDKEPQYGRLKLTQLCTDLAYALPLAAPYDTEHPEAPEFLPLDLCAYQLGPRPPGHIEMNVGKSSSEMIKLIHDAFQGIVGDQSDLLNPALLYNDKSRAPYVTLTERYAGFIRSGNIGIVRGRLEKFAATDHKGRVRALIRNGDKTDTVEDVVGIVYATGFTPQPSLDFLSPEIRKILYHDPQHNRLPILLDEHATLSYQLPSLAIIGFHEGAFWGSMEMEARLVEARWTSQAGANHSINDTTNRDTLLKLREAMNSKDADVPQYWMGDYVGLMETIARQVGITREDFDWSPRTGPISTFRYTTATDDKSETIKALQEYLSVIARSKTEAAFVSRASFLGMQGHWNIERSINSHLDSMPSGTLNGTASFHPRYPTDPAYDFEFLYTEKGTFSTTNGLNMQASRQYVYRYQESTDQITVWFVKQDSKTVDYLYHGLTFDIKSRGSQGWLAKADHLCVSDMYKSDYRFKFKGANLSSLTVTHAVKGPKKDYISETMYTR